MEKTRDSHRVSSLTKILFRGKWAFSKTPWHFQGVFSLNYRAGRYNVIQIDFDKMGGLIPAVIQDYQNGEVLMVAFMDKKTLDLTLKDGKTWFFSRTRNKYWMKGEESGNTQEVMEVLTDCDADTVVIKVRQNGTAACHTGNRSCFYVKWENGQWVEHSNPLFDPNEVYKKNE
jgi:phosphoribosyl-AMP cyclohydrolase